MEQLLEDLMPLKDIPSGGEVASYVEEIAPLTDDQRDLLGELFDDLEVVHEHIGRSCNILARLSGKLNSAQLSVSIRPIFQYFDQ